MNKDAETEALLPSASQTLELGFSIDVVEKEEKAGRWPDLTRLESRRPDILSAIVWMLSRGVAVRSICRALKPLSPCTVNAVRHDPRWQKAVVSESQTVDAMIEETLMLKVEQVRDDARDGKLPSAFDMKLLFDIRQLRTGGLTQRVEVVESEDERHSRMFFERARQAAGMVLEAEILPPRTGLLPPAASPVQENIKPGETD